MSEEKNLQVAVNYYDAMLNKNFEVMAEYLNKDIHFITPLAEICGKEGVMNAAKNFGKLLQNISITSQFTNNDQVMLAYNMTIPQPIGEFRASALMNFKNGQIIKIELFYDARPFEAKKDEIFKKQ